jgi:hypothetical protein
MPIELVNGQATLAAAELLMPLSRDVTHQDIMSEAMVLTNTTDNEENVSTTNIRNHINFCLTHLAELLTLAALPSYMMHLVGKLEVAANLTYKTDWINLVDDTVVGGDVSKLIRSVDRVAITGNVSNGDLLGSLGFWDISAIVENRNTLNKQYYQYLRHYWSGREIIIFTGHDISSPANGAAENELYDITSAEFAITARRRPLKADTRTQAGLTTLVDLPEEYHKLLIDMVTLYILKQKPTQDIQDRNLVQASVNEGLSMLTQQIAMTTQMEASSREKDRMGQSQKPVGM